MSPHLPPSTPPSASPFSGFKQGTCIAPVAESLDAHGVSQGQTPEIREQLESLDDAIFAAIGGDAAALDRARRLWNEASRTLPWELLEESREQYLRCAAEVTRRYKPSELRDPTTSIVALEMFDLLARE